MRFQKYFLLLSLMCFYSGCDSDKQDTEKEKLQKDVNEIKIRSDSTQKKFDSAGKDIDSISRIYKIDSIKKIDSTLKKINPLK